MLSLRRQHVPIVGSQSQRLSSSQYPNKQPTIETLAKEMLRDDPPPEKKKKKKYQRA